MSAESYEILKTIIKNIHKTLSPQIKDIMVKIIKFRDHTSLYINERMITSISLGIGSVEYQFSSVIIKKKVRIHLSVTKHCTVSSLVDFGPYDLVKLKSDAEKEILSYLLDSLKKLTMDDLYGYSHDIRNRPGFR